MTEKTEQAIEMARCADINLENLARWQPGVRQNPMFVLVRAQIGSVINLLEGGDGELKLGEQE